MFTCASCSTEHENPIAGETDPKTGKVVHFDRLDCWGQWLQKNPRFPMAQFTGNPHRQQHGDGLNW